MLRIHARWAVTLLGVGLLPLVAAAPPPRELGQAGRVEGFVRDAETGDWVGGATVELLQPADCASIKGSSFQTQPGGYYTINAPLGRLKSSFNWGDIGNLSILGLLTGGGKKITSYIEVSQLCLTVRKPGYATFAGPVPVWYSNSDNFRVELPVIELAPEGAGYRSFVGEDAPAGDLEVLPTQTLLQPGEPCEVRFLAREVPLANGHLPQILGIVFEPNAARMTWNVRTRQEPFEAVGVLGAKVGPRRPGVHRARFGLTIPSGGTRPTYAQRYFVVGVPVGREAEAQAAVDALNAGEAGEPLSSEARDARLAELESILGDNPDYQREIPALESVVAAVIAHDWEAARTAWGPLHKTAWDGDIQLGEIIGDALDVLREPQSEWNRRWYWIQMKSFRERLENQPASVRGPVRNPALLAALEAPDFPPAPAPAEAPAADPIARSVAALNDGDLETAEATFAKLDPKSRQSLPGQALAGRIALLSGDEPTARKLFAEALRPDNAKAVADYDAWVSYTRMLLADGDWDTAYPLLQLLLVYGRNAGTSRAAPRVGGYTPGLGFVTLLTGPARASAAGFARSEAALAQVLITVYPYLAKPADDPLSAAIGARALAEFGLLDRALTLSEAAAGAAADNEHVLAARSAVLLFNGRREEARQAVLQLRELNPKHPELARLAQAVNLD